MPLAEFKQIDEKALRLCLENIVTGIFGKGSLITCMDQTLSTYSSSYAAYRVNLQIDNMSKLRIFLKDMSFSRLVKDDIGQRRAREIAVYRDLLSHANLGTARYYGAVWDDLKKNYWLLLEFVEGTPVLECNLDYWIASASLLGRMYTNFAAQTKKLNQCDFLIRHDADFFRSFAQQTWHNTAQISKLAADRLVKVLQGYEQIIQVMTHQPLTLVHGSYRAQNILVDHHSAPLRLCLLDWEGAAFGSSFFDLAYLSDGFDDSTLDRVFAAYRDEALKGNAPVPPRNEMKYIVDCFRLHKGIHAVNSACEYGCTEAVILEVLKKAETTAKLVL